MESKLQNLQIEDNKSKDSSTNPITFFENKVKELYEFRDRYFENHPITEADLKTKRLNEKLEETLKFFKDPSLIAGVEVAFRAKYFYLLGRAHDVLEGHSPDAESALTKAVKLDPQLVEAWNQLGETYWKRDNMKEAKNCFQGALSKKENKVSMRSLSMVMRQEATTSREETVSNVERSVDLAKQAVKLDAQDSESWLVLANAYLSHFFTVQQNPQTLQQAMKAYKQAESLPLGKNNADLHYNKAVALNFEEEYESALQEFTYACELMPSWDTPRNQQLQLIQYLDATVDLIHSNGRLKAKKLAALHESIEDKQLGVYGGGQFTGTGGHAVTLEPRPLASLQEGLNTHSVILGKVICSVRTEASVPFTFCMMDKKKTVVAVTVYNMAAGQGVIIGDSVAIPEPFVTHHAFSFQKKKYSFTSIRVDNPLVMVVNGKKFGREKLAGTQLSTSRIAH